MAYTPTNWQTGDIITAEKLNKLEGGVAALSNYDIVFTETSEDITADGLSFEELFQKGERNLNGGFDGGSIFEKATTFKAFIDSEVNVVMFGFASTRNKIYLYENGQASINGTTYTYTYSNGHYVFTSSESGGGGV